MYVVIWLALAAFATLFTGMWVLGRDRIYIKGAVSLASWSILAITGEGVYALTDTGDEIAVGSASLQYLAAGLAVLSFFILLLYRFDEYPPRREGQHNPGRQ